MSRLLLFAGTTEGRELAEYLERQEMPCDICVATEYGEALLDPAHTIHTVHAGRKTDEEMTALMAERGITHVVDATHPYAALVSENIQKAAARVQAAYYRLLRRASAPEEMASDPSVVFVDTLDAAIAYLEQTQGAILAATGSKELHKYTALTGYQDRVYARILSTGESMQIAERLGFQGKHLICMQGPFSREMNVATLRMVGAAYLVTKESGRTGGFPEKLQAAREAGAVLVVIGRPPQAQGYDPLQIRRILIDQLGMSVTRQISVVGIGMGHPMGMTREAWAACEEAEVLIGAGRMLKTVASLAKPCLTEYRAAQICTWLREHPEIERVAILLSGDVGFYSGAHALRRQLTRADAGLSAAIRVCPGISSVVYLTAKLGMDWEDVKLVSVHGRSQNVVAAVRDHRRVFALVGKQESLRELLGELVRYGLEDVTVHVGSDLSYETEQILSGTPEQLLDAPLSDLSAVLIEHPGAKRLTTHGMEDTAFLREKTPMTKSEVRTISLSRLGLEADSVIYDVGAGTGSVSVEMARCAPEGMVYAIERKHEAAELIGRNARLHAVSNLEVVEGLAPEALRDLPRPTHAFIGGSAGNMQEILTLLLQKNAQLRIVVNAIALETVAETLSCIRALPVRDVDIVSVTAARGNAVGPYHMMMGQNPVYIISFTGRGDEEGQA